MTRDPLNTIKNTAPVAQDHGVQRGNQADKRRLKAACQGFEAIFIHEMLKSMRKTIPKSGLLDGGLRERIYESMFDEAVSRSLSHRGALGIADMLYREFAPHIPGEGSGR